jgi:conjugal transfer pilus assembly protein TraV
MKKLAALFTMALSLSGCASMLDPNGASSTFSCSDPNDPSSAVDGATCKTPIAIYKSTHGPAPIKASDLPIGVTLADYDAEQGAKRPVNAQHQKALTDSVYEGQSYQLPGQLEPQDQAKFARPVRVPAMVMRIWLASWIDANDDLHFPSHIFTEVQARRWAFGTNESMNAGILVPTKQLEAVPQKAVKPNDRQPQREVGQLKPYEPIGTGSQMPILP